MAPEVCLSKPYGLKVDVYSFGLFFWQLCTLKQPFGEITADWHERWVVKRDTRPQIPSSLPPFVRDIIQACWSPKPSDRPSFKAICDRMPRDISLLQEVGVSMLHDRSQHLVNKSQHSAEVFMEKLKKGKD
jgi:serine/threonine protein kinase